MQLAKKSSEVAQFIIICQRLKARPSRHLEVRNLGVLKVLCGDYVRAIKKAHENNGLAVFESQVGVLI